MSSEFIITKESHGQRLDKFLVSQLPELSRSQIQKMIKAGPVLVNGQPTSVHHFLKEGDTIILKSVPSGPYPEPCPDECQDVSESPSKECKYKLEIIYDDPNFLVVNKQAGLLVHEAPGHQETTLVDLLLEKYPEMAKIGEDPIRPGLMHRLDRDVSGLMVIAKTPVAFDHLKSQFKQRKIKKEYTALVYGQPAKLEGEIEFAIDRSVKGFKMAALPRQRRDKPTNGEGKKAITMFEVLERFKNFSLLKLTPETGRTHQIRVHLNAYGLPIVGDETYKPKKLKGEIKLDRIFLEANYLGFYDLENNWKEFRIPLSPELNNILKGLKS